MKTIILGAGLAGITAAYFLQEHDGFDDIVILEKEKEPFGLCRSIKKDGYIYDIGPHILFSKDKEMLGLMLSVLDERNDLRRSNQIIYKGRYVQYPFENDLSKLPAEDLAYCINSFEHNPYEQYDASNMIQFFLKTFGEGITNCYLRPYNEKIWKYDPAFMNTSMVERIPKPTKEEIRRSAAGETVDGYVHQLYFSYPAQGSIEAVPQGFLKRLDREKCRVETGKTVAGVRKTGDRFLVETEDGREYTADRLISTIPVQELTKACDGVPAEVSAAVGDLRYNSIIISFIKTPYDLCGDNFAFMVPDKDVIFHRISKMDFLGTHYHRENEATYMVEITYREKDAVDRLTDAEVQSRIAEGMCRIGFANRPEDVTTVDMTRRQYAYVIYDLDHGRNMKTVRDFYAGEGITLHGRFGNFEYWNMDRILRESLELSERFTAAGQYQR